MLTVGSLFSGVGGFDLGLERAGMEVIFQCEIDAFCQKVLKKHWPNVKLYDDIKQINRTNTVSPDVLVGGPPCQPASVAGKRKGTSDDRWLWPETLRVVKELKPTWCLFENPTGILSLEGGVPFEQVLSEMENQGYEVQAFIIPACSVGAPHRRDRVWIIAHARELRMGNVAGSGSYQDLKRELPEAAQRRQTRPVRDKATSFVGDFTSVVCETGNDRTDDGLPRKMEPNRVNRLKALGNAVVPQVVEILGRAILDYEGLID